MSKSFRALHWPALVLLGLGAQARPLAAPLAGVARVTAVRDTGFAVPDSVRALLTWVNCLVVQSDSSLYLADQSLGGILHLGARGEFRSVIGRPGSGPGEFRSVLMVGVYGDSLWALDPAEVRLTILPLNGSGALTVPVSSSAPMLPAGSRPQARIGLPYSILPDGTFLVYESIGDPLVAPDRLEAVLLRTTRNLEVLDTLFRSTTSHSHMAFSYRDGETHYTQPFSDDPVYAVASDGSLVVAVKRTVPGKSGQGSFTVTALQGGREQAYTRQIEYDGLRLPQTIVDSAVNGFFGPGRGVPSSPITADSMHRRLFRPAYFPPVEVVKIARDGSVWLKVHFADSPRDVGDWLVLSRRGFPMYRVSLPASFRLLEASNRIVWGVEGDPLDVPLLVRYTVPRHGRETT